jgi:hypothetical protein
MLRLQRYDGSILEILEPDKTFEVEFPREDGSNYGDKTFTIVYR